MLTVRNGSDVLLFYFILSCGNTVTISFIKLISIKSENPINSHVTYTVNVFTVAKVEKSRINECLIFVEHLSTVPFQISARHFVPATHLNVTLN